MINGDGLSDAERKQNQRIRQRETLGDEEYKKNESRGNETI